MHGTLHSFLAWVLMITLAMGCFAFAQYARVLLHWHGWFVYSLITGILILLFWEAFVQGADGAIAGLVPIVGLTERLSAGSHALWICLLVVTLFFKKGARVSMPENDLSQ
jgi:cell division protein FtsW (lipid II flippase)